MRSLAMVILGFVFLDELAVMAAFGVWGGTRPTGALVLAVVLPVLAMTVWFLFASPKARYGGPVVRPVVKAVVFGLASLALWDADRPGWALALLVFSVVVNGLAQLPFVQATLADLEQGPTSRDGAAAGGA